MEVEACGRERPVPGVAVGGLEVAGGGEGPGRRVPEAAAEVGDQRQRRPQRRDLSHEGRVLRHTPQRVVQRALPPLDAPRRLVDAQRRQWLGRGLRCRRRHGGREMRAAVCEVVAGPKLRTRETCGIVDGPGFQFKLLAH